MRYSQKQQKSVLIKGDIDSFYSYKVKTAKTRSERIQARIDSITNKNKYSRIFSNHISTLICVLLLYGFVFLKNFYIHIDLTLQQMMFFSFVLCVICLYRSSKAINIYKIGIYKKSNAFFAVFYGLLFLIFFRKAILFSLSLL